MTICPGFTAVPLGCTCNFNFPAFSRFLPVHKSSRARFQQSSTEDAHVILRAIAGVRVVPELLRQSKFTAVFESPPTGTFLLDFAVLCPAARAPARNKSGGSRIKTESDPINGVSRKTRKIGVYIKNVGAS